MGVGGGMLQAANIIAGGLSAATAAYELYEQKRADDVPTEAELRRKADREALEKGQRRRSAMKEKGKTDFSSAAVPVMSAGMNLKNNLG